MFYYVVVVLLCVAGRSDGSYAMKPDRSGGCGLIHGSEKWDLCHKMRGAVSRLCACTCDPQCRIRRKEAAEKRIHECCRQNDVRPQCMKFCTYNPPNLHISKMQHCSADMERILYCAADGQNNVGCCRQRGVSSACDKFCSGEVPSSDEIVDNEQKYLECFTKQTQIMSCMRDSIPMERTWKAHRVFHHNKN